MRILHSMLRVTDLPASIRFYTEVLGMRLLRQKDYPEGRFTLAFVGYQDEKLEAALELTFNWETHSYTQGTGYGHLAIEVADAAQTCAHARSLGHPVIREAGVMKHGHTVIAFLQDPDGYKIELIQKGTQAD
ncbi:lactoylglutathione lyase [Pseudomonas sp. 5P_3.1_Bac2]|uniref:lactoylglutathione lyase n=1 Tax=Pseudomonas sp. 5P_3.1_Bac2 TaxID=2971617 RepID=UPI0021C9CB57|nr:lactoylglutathione lyase [Pseudomonas sp. 5P_3.1_Bac2]MCU1715897.1 lactoylglutathione lyase [Pseudomonas sp. 5P_3.1_Bac2]